MTKSICAIINQALCYFTTLLVLTFTFSQTSEASTQFTHLEAEHGLSMNTVNDIVTDQTGYLWIATQAGLNRYNGSEITTYLKQDPFGPSGNHISKLYISQQGELWLVTLNDGINRYIKTTKQFEHFNDEALGLPQSGINDISDDKLQRIVIATDEGLYLFSLQDKQVVAHITEGQQGLLSNNIWGLYRDNQARLWVYHEYGLQLFDVETSQFISFKNPLLSQPVTTVTQGEGDSLWIATQNDDLLNVDFALARLSLMSPTIVSHNQFLPKKLQSQHIKDLQIDNQGKLWIAFEQSGIANYQVDTHTLQHLHHSASNINSLSSDVVNRLWIDDEQQLWVATNGAGLSKTDLQSRAFNAINQYSFSENNIKDTDVRSIYRDHHSQLWIGTAQGLYLALENDKRDITGFTLFEHKDFNAKSFVSFTVQNNNYLWIGTRGEGLYRLNITTQEITQFTHQSNDPKSIASDYLYNYYFDDKQQLWITTKDGGLSLFIENQQRFQNWSHSSNNPEGLPSNEVSQILQDNQGEYWVLTYGSGLVHMSPEGKFTQYAPNTLTGFPSKHLFNAYVIEDTLWISSSDGIFSFNPTSKAIHVINKQNGLVGNVAYLMVKDQHNQLWVGTSDGLSVINVINKSIRNYTVVDGLQDNEFNFNAGFVDSGNRVYLGGINGFNMLYPFELPSPKKPKTPVIDEFYLLNQLTRIQDDSRFKQPLDISYSNSIQLNYQDSLFSFKFCSINLQQASDLSYEYRMIGLHEQWFTDIDSHIAHFSGLAPGKYQFQVRAKNSDNQTSHIRKLDIIITPAPWQTWWAYLLYTLLAISVVCLLIFLQSRKYRAKVKMMEQVAKSEQRLQLALWGSGDEFWDWDLENHTANRQNTFLCYPEPEISLEDTLKKVVHPDDYDELIAKTMATINSTDMKFEYTYRALLPNNTYVWILNRGQIIERNEKGYPKRVTGTIKNIQSLKETEQALTRLNLELEDRVKARTEELKHTQNELIDKEKMATLGGLVASITHEINTPIGISVTAITHLSDSVEVFNSKYQNDDVSNEDFEQYQKEVSECARLVLNNLQRAATLIQSFKKVSVDQSHDDEADIDLKQYLNEIFISLDPLLSRTPHHYNYFCPEGLLIRCQPGVLYQIVSNLFNNSIIHAYPDGKVGALNLTVSQTQKGIVIVYSDDGCGMSEEIQSQIFTPFFTTKRGKGGSGLGMNILYNLVNQVLKGTVSLETSPGHGAVFTITLPKSILVKNKENLRS